MLKVNKLKERSVSHNVPQSFEKVSTSNECGVRSVSYNVWERTGSNCTSKTCGGRSVSFTNAHELILMGEKL